VNEITWLTLPYDLVLILYKYRGFRDSSVLGYLCFSAHLVRFIYLFTYCLLPLRKLSTQKYMSGVCKIRDFYYLRVSLLIHCFTVRVPSLFSIMPIPVLRSMLSKVVLPSEQGEWNLFFKNAVMLYFRREMHQGHL